MLFGLPNLRGTVRGPWSCLSGLQERITTNASMFMYGTMESSQLKVALPVTAFISVCWSSLRGLQGVCKR